MKPAPATPEQALASAYLDGDVTVVERARVDASPELLALVASMRDTSAMIADLPASSATARETGIAAALAEFDSLANGKPVSAGNVVSLADRRRWPTTVLTTAAAVVLIGVVAISVLRSSSDGKSDTAASATESKRSETVVADDASGGAQPANASDEVVLQSVASPLEINDPQELLTLTLAAATADSSPADTTAGGAETAPAPERFNSYNVDALACLTETQVFLADIYYRGMLAIAARDTVTGVTEAIDGNCTVLARVGP